MPNLFENIPAMLTQEIFETLVQSTSVRVERIISEGQTSPESGWYDQQEHEWVLVLQGAAQITLEDGRVIMLTSGDYLLLEKHQKHRVSWTSPGEKTVWLAIFFD